MPSGGGELPGPRNAPKNKASVAKPNIEIQMVGNTNFIQKVCADDSVRSITNLPMPKTQPEWRWAEAVKMKRKPSRVRSKPRVIRLPPRNTPASERGCGIGSPAN